MLIFVWGTQYECKWVVYFECPIIPPPFVENTIFSPFSCLGIFINWPHMWVSIFWIPLFFWYMSLCFCSSLTYSLIQSKIIAIFLSITSVLLHSRLVFLRVYYKMTLYIYFTKQCEMCLFLTWFLCVKRKTVIFFTNGTDYKNNDKTNWYLMWIHGDWNSNSSQKVCHNLFYLCTWPFWALFLQSKSNWTGCCQTAWIKKALSNTEILPDSSLSSYIYTSRDDSRLVLTSHRRCLLVSGTQDTLGPKACEWQRQRPKRNGQKQRLHGTDAICDACCLFHSPGLGSRLNICNKPRLMRACTRLSNNYVSLTRIELKVRIFLCKLMCSDAGTGAWKVFPEWKKPGTILGQIHRMKTLF